MSNTLYIKITTTEYYDSTTALKGYYLSYAMPVLMNGGAYYYPSFYFEVGASNPTASPYAQFPDPATAIAYYNPTQQAQMISDANSLLGTTFYSSSVVSLLDAPVNDAFGALATVAKTGAYSDLTGKPVINTRVFSNPTRTLNSAYQISTTQDAVVSYAIDISASLSLTGGQTGVVSLQYADDSGFTTNVKTVNAGSSGNTGALTIGLGLTQTTSVTVSGVVPAAKYAKLITASTTGSPTFAFRSAQEVLI